LNSLWAHDHSYYYFLIQWLTFLLLCYCVSTWCSSWLPVHLLFIAVLGRGYTVAFTKVFTMCQIYILLEFTTSMQLAFEEQLLPCFFIVLHWDLHIWGHIWLEVCIPCAPLFEDFWKLIWY
jgi:hypothetical protein